MSEGREQKYQKRWQRQYDYYSKSSKKNKQQYQRLQVAIMVAGVAIPVLINMDIPVFWAETPYNAPMPTIVPTLLGLFVAIATGFERVYRHGDNWRNYRQSVEAMKREASLYETSAGEYKKHPDPFTLFVERSEAIFGEETNRFNQYSKIEETGKQPNIIGRSR